LLLSVFSPSLSENKNKNYPLKDTLYEVTNSTLTMDDVLFLTEWNLGAWRSPFAVFLPEKQAQFLHRHK
jgi:hypothetical protein